MQRSPFKPSMNGHSQKCNLVANEQTNFIEKAPNMPPPGGNGIIKIASGGKDPNHEPLLAILKPERQQRTALEAAAGQQLDQETIAENAVSTYSVSSHVAERVSKY